MMKRRSFLQIGFFGVGHSHAAEKIKFHEEHLDQGK
jgi:hypothetical protein